MSVRGSYASTAAMAITATAEPSVGAMQNALTSRSDQRDS